MVTKTFIILGPTCTGKTSLGLKLCQKFNGAIISADSRQVVRYMDIGTGKLPIPKFGSKASINARASKVVRMEDRWVIDGIDVYGYDLVNPDQYFSSHDFVKYCEKILPRVSRDGKNIFVVGGTGFYIDSLAGKIPLVGVGPDLELRKYLDLLGLAQLRQKLLDLNPAVYEKTDTKNPVRMIRAIEKSLGREISRERSALLTNPVYVGLTSNRENLYKRADAWVDEIFGPDLFDEVKEIKKMFPKSHRLGGLIYRTVVSYLSGQVGAEDAKQRAKFDMHAYIRRQQTWFKRNSSISWFDISDPNFDERLYYLVESNLNGR